MIICCFVNPINLWGLLDENVLLTIQWSLFIKAA